MVRLSESAANGLTDELSTRDESVGNNTCTCRADQNPDGQTALVQAALKDLAAQRREHYFKPPQSLTHLLEPILSDQRDLPILYLFWNVSVTVLPASVIVFVLPSWSAILGPLYLACSYLAFLERYLLALHYSEHRRLFQPGACQAGFIEEAKSICSHSQHDYTRCCSQVALGSMVLHQSC